MNFHRLIAWYRTRWVARFETHTYTLAGVPWLPQALLSLISGGPNAGYSGGIFGHGTYFAEDAGKNDQYVTRDARFGAIPDLHRLLYEHIRHPDEPVYYLLLCRVTAGAFLRTRDGDAPPRIRTWFLSLFMGTHGRRFPFTRTVLIDGPQPYTRSRHRLPVYGLYGVHC